MNSQDIKNYLSDPASLNDESEAGLKKAIGSYPFCSLLYLLLARSHRNRKSAVLEEVIEKAAAYSPDREGLYQFLHAPAAEITVAAEKENAAPEEDFILEEAPVPQETAIPEEEATPEEEAAEPIAAEVPAAETPVAGANESGAKQAAAGMSLEKKAAPGEIALSIDDQLPRTFTFWLRRIRQVTMQEEVESTIHSIRMDTSRAVVLSDGLEKSYYNEILHQNTASEYQSKVKVEYDLQKKEDRIIAKFIGEDPQVIKSAMNIKAKEIPADIPEEPGDGDNDGGVISETLAKIYIDQNLTAKAIQVYKKLSLRFPEKKAYFASLIEKLRK